VYDQDVIFIFGHMHKISHACTFFGPLRVWKGLVMGGEMTKTLCKVEYQQTKNGLVSRVQWVGLQNPIFGLGKINLVIGLKVKGKMLLGETYNGLFKKILLGDE
jgi:hypothetical protein